MNQSIISFSGPLYALQSLRPTRNRTSVSDNSSPLAFKGRYLSMRSHGPHVSLHLNTPLCSFPQSRAAGVRRLQLPPSSLGYPHKSSLRHLHSPNASLSSNPGDPTHHRRQRRPETRPNFHGLRLPWILRASYGRGLVRHAGNGPSHHVLAESVLAYRRARMARVHGPGQERWRGCARGTQ